MDLAHKNLRVDGIINYYKERLVVEGYKQKEDVSFLDTQQTKGVCSSCTRKQRA